ncbi:InlB B-repeat-containing protein [Aquimarina aggregata]|uniref:InlB B-repeat-containing protein n=1 Tax=Aquimarina aggregata TaxID=1642818 RepID=UPI0024939F81|nr:fibronectin type III domain-containing protein [Aquimarina aggregata]
MKKLFFLFAILIGLQAVQASNGKYRLTLRENPSTSIVIGWDQTSGNSPVVHYGTTDFGTNYSSYPNTKTPDRAVSYKGMNNNFARLTGLTPNTAYYFVIRDSQGTSQRMWFKTAPADNSRLSFIAGGDSRNNRSPRQNANRLVAKLKPHAVLFGGDMTNSDSSSQWRQWMDDWQLTIASDGRMFPIVATRGNHEDSNNSIYNLFDVPSSNVYYAITFGQNLVRTYTLNTEISISGSQTTWLRNDLTANPNTIWKMAQYHKPMRPHVSSKREGNDQYNNWAQLFYDNNVKLVIECDAHTVKTTWPLRPATGSGSDEGFVRDDENGTVYAGEGCWGAPLRSNNDNKSWTRNSARFNQFKWIFVDENKIETRTIKVDNASQVGSVSNTNVFAIPSNLDIWNPSNGSVVTINAAVTTPDNEAPTIPTNLISSNITSSSVSLTWNASTDNISVAGYDVYQGDSKIGATATAAFNVTGLSPNTAYTFKVKAKDAAGNVSAFSAVENVTTLDGSTTLYNLGITTVGTSNSTHTTRRAMPYTLSENGVLQSITIHVEGGTGDIQLGVYEDNNGTPGTRLGQTAITQVRSTRGWQTVPLQNAVNVNDGDTVWLAWMFSNNPGVAYVSGSPGRYQADGTSWSANGDNMPSSYGSGGQSNFRYSVYASYLRNTSSVTYFLTTNAVGQGTVSGGGTYNEGVSATLTATPAVGWQFDGWSGALTGGTNPSSIIMNADKNVTATFTETDPGGGQTGTVNVAIIDGSDDVEERENGTLYTNSSDLEMVYDGSRNGYQKVGLRFRALDIPKNATITNAYLQFTADESNGASASLEISLHDSSNSPAFSSSNNVSNRVTFSEKVTWNPQSWSSNQNGNAQRSPNLKGMVQSLVNKSSWVSGNNLSFIIRGKGNSLTNTSAKRVADSYEGGAAKAARLIVEYSTTGGKSFITLNNKESFNVYPNPFTSTLQISTSLLVQNRDYTVIIYDLSGKVMHKEVILSKFKNENISIAPKINRKGIYLLSISNESNEVIEIKRIIKK